MDEAWLGFHCFQGVPSPDIVAKTPISFGLVVGLMWVDVGLYLWVFHLHLIYI